MEGQRQFDNNDEDEIAHQRFIKSLKCTASSKVPDSKTAGFVASETGKMRNKAVHDSLQDSLPVQLMSKIQSQAKELQQTHAIIRNLQNEIKEIQFDERNNTLFVRDMNLLSDNCVQHTTPMDAETPSSKCTQENDVESGAEENAKWTFQSISGMISFIISIVSFQSVLLLAITIANSECFKESFPKESSYEIVMYGAIGSTFVGGFNSLSTMCLIVWFHRNCSDDRKGVKVFVFDSLPRFFAYKAERISEKKSNSYRWFDISCTCLHSLPQFIIAALLILMTHGQSSKIGTVSLLVSAVKITSMLKAFLDVMKLKTNNLVKWSCSFILLAFGCGIIMSNIWAVGLSRYNGQVDLEIFKEDLNNERIVFVSVENEMMTEVKNKTDWFFYITTDIFEHDYSEHKAYLEFRERGQNATAENLVVTLSIQTAATTAGFKDWAVSCVKYSRLVAQRDINKELIGPIPVNDDGYDDAFEIESCALNEEMSKVDAPEWKFKIHFKSMAAHCHEIGERTA